MEISTFGLAIFLTWCVLSVIVLSPIECVIVRLSVQRPERQQPLHLAYARLSSNAPSGPAPYNNQAQVQNDRGQSTENGAQYRDEGFNQSTPVTATGQSPEVQPRPSFAITDDEEDEGEAETKQGEAEVETKKADAATKTDLIAGLNGNAAKPDSSSSVPSPTPQTTSNPSPLPPRVLGGGPPPRPSPMQQNPYGGIEEQPSEPVIALRPCDEPQSAEEAARVEGEGFGAPTVERYSGMIDCLNKLVDEEGIEALYRGAWVTLLGVLAGNFS